MSDVKVIEVLVWRSLAPKKEGQNGLRTLATPVKGSSFEAPDGERKYHFLNQVFTSSADYADADKLFPQGTRYIAGFEVLGTPKAQVRVDEDGVEVPVLDREGSPVFRINVRQDPDHGYKVTKSAPMIKRSKVNEEIIDLLDTFEL